MNEPARVGLMARLHEHDVRALGYLVRRRHRRLDGFMCRFTHVGDAPVVIGAALFLMALPFGQLRAAGIRAALALATSHLLVQVLKRTLSRPRPRLPVGVASLIQAPDRFSFPSGHAAAALSVTVAIATVAVMPIALLLLAIGLLVGVSRCYLGVHYPGDVLAGWLLGLVGVLLAVLRTTIGA